MLELLKNLVDSIIHIDVHLKALIEHFGTGTYFLLFAIIFAETGLVITPFLPGDSLLFAVGAFSAQGTFHVGAIFCLLWVASVLGDSVNYAIGKYFGDKLMHAKHVPFFKPEYLERTHKFFEKYGGKTIVIARFVPIVRTFAPFVAGLGQMSYRTFFTYNVVGGFLWVALFVYGGYFFGNIPIVQDNFSVVIGVIIFLSILPAVIEYLKAKKSKSLS